MMNLYTEAGWLNIPEIIKAFDTHDFIFITGGRGIGKTYGAIEYLIKFGIKFVLLRRLELEAQLQADLDTSSLRPVLEDMGYLTDDHTILFKKIAGKLTIVYIDGAEVCAIAALSTFSTLRGIDLTRYKLLLYDEFIPELHVRALKAEGMAFSQVYETIDRNRQLNGEPALKALLLSNSLNMANDIFLYYDLVNDVQRMAETPGLEILERGNKLIILSQMSPISNRKRDTALYKAASEEFSRMAISNKFILNDMTYVKKRNLAEFIIICKVGDLYIYKHKSDAVWYVTFTRGETKKIYTTGAADLERFRRDYWRLWSRYLDGQVYFEKYLAVTLFEKYYKQ